MRFALASGIAITLLVVLAFGSAFVGLRLEPVARILFMLALALLGARALLTFLREVMDRAQRAPPLCVRTCNWASLGAKGCLWVADGLLDAKR